VADSGGIGNAAGGGRRIARTAEAPLPVCRVPLPGNGAERVALVDHEWLVTNGIGGYSSGTVAGVITRRYHGLLVAALPNPLGRMVMLNTVAESIDASSLAEFRLDGGVPVWRHKLNGGETTVEKRVFMPYRQNTVIMQYRVEGQAPTKLRLTPAVHFRKYEAPVSEPLHDEYSFTASGQRFSLAAPAAAGVPPLRFAVEGHFAFVLDEERREQVMYAVEESRGYQARGALWSPGAFVIDIAPGESAALIASTEELDVMNAMTAAEALEVEGERKRRLIDAAPQAARGNPGAQLVVAADQFVIKPVGRVRDTIRATGVGEELRTVIAGYHWFTDWGRDTMISLEGLTLSTGRHREAGFILRTFAQYVRDGLIPNLFPDGSDEGLYHTSDATLWFFHALDRYAQVTEYWSLVEQTLPKMRGIVEAHLKGTRFGIGVDTRDGLLRQGAEGYQLTWMDAKVDDWVVTPRRGKAVEINALWYNALCLLSRWECDLGDTGRSNRYSEEAARVRESFNKRFWYDQSGHLYDVVDGPDGDDAACRPNQIFAISLPNPVLDESRWGSVLSVVQKKLLTPVGLRSLSPDHPDYKPRYFGDLRARDAAYHQGTVWAWLIGPWIDAWLKVHREDKAGARRFLDGLIAHLPAFGVGSIAEIFDAEPPFTPRGCIAQAWSVAEVLRCWMKTAE
jgi:predicted glycogen debranching enzyme